MSAGDTRQLPRRTVRAENPIQVLSRQVSYSFNDLAARDKNELRLAGRIHGSNEHFFGDVVSCLLNAAFKVEIATAARLSLLEANGMRARRAKSRAWQLGPH